MKINSWPKLFAALLGIFLGFNLPEIWAFLVSLFR
jgi:hypothetical protein